MPSTFKRKEKKYMLTKTQLEDLLNRIEDYVEETEFFDEGVMSIYYDNASDYLIRTSIEKPIFKEKLRVRCYGQPKPDGPVFTEIKRKYEGIVYKRRTTVKANEMNQLQTAKFKDSQVGAEIKDFLQRYPGLQPKIFIYARRLSYQGIEDHQLRITFDTEVNYRYDNVDFFHGTQGHSLLPEGKTLMEIKINNAMPLWLAHILDELAIYPASFSKYGEAYKKELMEELL